MRYNMFKHFLYIYKINFLYVFKFKIAISQYYSNWAKDKNVLAIFIQNKIVRHVELFNSKNKKILHVTLFCSK